MSPEEGSILKVRPAEGFFLSSEGFVQSDDTRGIFDVEEFAALAALHGS